MTATLTRAASQPPARVARRPPARLRAAVALLLSVVLVATATSGYQARHAHAELFSTTVGIHADGRRALVSAGASFYPGTRVLRTQATGDAAGAREAARQRGWLAAGVVPASASRFADMASDALLDLDKLTPPGSGAAVAGWSASWRYVWPRDAAFTAAALAQTGHLTDAVRTLAFLQRVQEPDGTFQARYLLDGSGVPDDRGTQLDGTGWALWGTYRTIRETSDARARTAVAAGLRPLLTRSTDAVMRMTGGAGRLPPVSSDYWETKEDQLTLGTAAAILCGLRAAAATYVILGDERRSRAVAARADEVEAAVHAVFGPETFPRTVGGAPDAAVAFLLPPFQPKADPAVVQAFHEAGRAMRRPAGGLAPGADWKQDGISWTPETAIFALVASYTGDQAQARSRLDWLDAHRTSAGSIPEKVLSNGDPAAVAPLAWSAATVLLTLSNPALGGSVD